MKNLKEKPEERLKKAISIILSKAETNRISPLVIYGSWDMVMGKLPVHRQIDKGLIKSFTKTIEAYKEDCKKKKYIQAEMEIPLTEISMKLNREALISILK